MSRIRVILISGAAGGIICSLAALYGKDLTGPNLKRFASINGPDLMRIGSLVFSVAVIVALVVAFFVVAARRRRKNQAIKDNEEMKGYKHQGLGWLLGGIGVGLVVFVLIVADIWIGHGLRSFLHLQGVLPKGNLAVAGGKLGWFFTILVAVIVGAAVLNKERLSKLTPRLPKLPSMPTVSRPSFLGRGKGGSKRERRSKIGADEWSTLPENGMDDLSRVESLFDTSTVH